jgi:hypothetical protein
VGLSWEQVNYGLNGVHVYSMTIDDQDHMYVLTTLPGLFDGYYRSMDNGSSWESVDWVPDINYALDIVGVDSSIYAINDQTIFITNDAGQTWSLLTDGLNQDESFSTGADLELSPSGYLYAAGRYVHRSSQPVFTTSLDIKPINVLDEFSFKLFPTYPNPFNSTTTIRFSIETKDLWSLCIFDITGRVVETLANETIEPGTHEVNWDANNYPSGIYFVQLKSERKSMYQKITFLK